ncbi:rhodanese domain-containing protein CG4456-like [Asterias rubens]|uniref:rhodanese domain-containing protein CG4456-like n=1 Tax=Asterias rubens TaxID=7604 RepID=UPI001455313A|nr:rhodanese domain-containing protein CG4456-like [Asterias rubens]XP_033638052.1 rhodanese domain-containing protein CG4456-like [Asterias rubens]XP_033638053.1 rhodanese domain-containing protein CG4456-like [Asterias rubens]
MEKGDKMESPLLEDEQNVYYDGLVKRIQSGDLQLIEVRNAPELAQTGTIIENICHVPVPELEEALQLSDEAFLAKYGHPKPQKTQDNVVFTCRIGNRSLKALNIAKALGYTKARHYPGGWTEWIQKNPRSSSSN